MMNKKPMPNNLGASRRKLIDALLAIHVTTGQVRVDLTLAQALDRAWDEYDAAVRATPMLSAWPAGGVEPERD